MRLSHDAIHALRAFICHIPIRSDFLGARPDSERPPMPRNSPNTFSLKYIHPKSEGVKPPNVEALERWNICPNLKVHTAFQQLSSERHVPTF